MDGEEQGPPQGMGRRSGWSEGGIEGGAGDKSSRESYGGRRDTSPSRDGGRRRGGNERGYPTEDRRRQRRDGEAHSHRHERSDDRRRSFDRGSKSFGRGSRDQYSRSKDNGRYGRNRSDWRDSDRRSNRSDSWGDDGRRSYAEDRDYSYGRGRAGRSRSPPRRRSSRSRSRSPEHVRLPPKPGKSHEWPPNFDTHGTSYVFDTRSGMFYESRSDFFYDPKNKLYYGNKKKAYYRYDGKSDPPFVMVQEATQSTEDKPEPNNEFIPEISSGNNAGNKTPKPTIAIKLKTKKISSKNKTSKSPAEAAAAPVISRAQKDQVANIEKWKEKQAELKKDEGAAAAASKIPEKCPTVDGKVKRTAKGEPMCVICKRKFPTVEKLRLHEKASELHKKNLEKLEKKRAEAAKRKESPSIEYQDRAQKRRQLHEPQSAAFSLSQAKAAAAQARKNDVKPTPTEVIAPAATLGESNIGNQMLQKMGWEAGSALGGKSARAKQNGSSAGDCNNAGEANNIPTTNDSLRKDWERIEALARSGLS